MDGKMERNHTIMQFFEWHIPADGTLWNQLKEAAPALKEAGIDAVWLPPATKGQSAEDTGYGIYDGYDLGEFDQKGTVRTKYGTKDELHAAIEACHSHKLCVYLDLVMNHRAGADATENFEVVEVNPMDRTEEISEPFEIEGWTKFTYPGRQGKYSSFTWNSKYFNGTDYDQKSDRNGVFKIQGEDKEWNKHVDEEFGNYDYLMFANIDYNNQAVREEMINWGKWLIETTGCDGFRLDAIKHINYKFITQFAHEMLNHVSDRNFYLIGEFWNPDLDACRAYLDETDYKIDLFDVALHYKLCQASKEGGSFDLSAIFDDTLVQSHPMNTVTFVDNHDSQPHEALESWVEDWFKPLAYALILLRRDGYPCVFYGDYYGIGGPEPKSAKKEVLDSLLSARFHKAYGEQEDYFDHPSTIGWVRFGTGEIPFSGCAVVLANGEPGEKRMFVGESRAGEQWSDLTGFRDDQVQIGEDGWATFPVNGGSVSVWANPETSEEA